MVDQHQDGPRDDLEPTEPNQPGAAEQPKASEAEELGTPGGEPLGSLGGESSQALSASVEAVTESVDEVPAPTDAAPTPAEEPVEPAPEPLVPEMAAPAPVPAPPVATPEPSIAATVQVPPLEGTTPSDGDGGEWELLSSKVEAWLAGGRLQEIWQSARTPLSALLAVMIAVVVLRIYGALLGALNSLPLLPGLLELVGVVWILRRGVPKLVRTREREELLENLSQRWSAFRGKR